MIFVQAVKKQNLPRTIIERFQFQSAVGWDHVEKVEKHESQKDYKSGFGGEFGVQQDRFDKNAAGWDHVEKVEKHESQKGNCFVYVCHVTVLSHASLSRDQDYTAGFGGKFGVQTDRVDKSALGWEHVEKVEKHESQKGEK